MIKRIQHLQAIARLLKRYPVVGILGARQVGKTTLARELARREGGKAAWYDLEEERDLARLEHPGEALAGARGLVVLDEVQRRPDIFPALRVLADRPGHPARFLVLGSASPRLLRQSSESLAGRIAYYELPGFNLAEAGKTQRLWLRGGFPLSFTAGTDQQSFHWRRQFIRSFLERDIPSLGLRIPAPTLRRFWAMLAHYHGQVWNASAFAQSFGVSDMTVRRYLDQLSATYMIWQLQPWYENLGKRQVKSPKIYFSDPGLLHVFLETPTLQTLQDHPKSGASWEGFALAQVVQRLGSWPEECHFWATHAGAELDLFVNRGTARLGFEFKKNLSPSVTPSMRHALSDLKLDSLDVVYPGDETYPLAAGVRALGIGRLWKDLKPLR